MDIKHKHAGHLIIVEGHPFKANNAGQWNLTEIWQTLKLPKGKAPGRWRGKERDRLSRNQNLDSAKVGAENHLLATKRATIEYAGWVSDEFKDAVYDAFEAVLERPEVAHVVAEIMRDMGHTHSATIVERSAFHDRCDWKALHGIRRNTIKGLKAAVRKGHLTADGAHVIARRDGLRVSLAALELEAI
ncbi:hypothetical protein [Stutzerimonas nitrititolerans]|uniref:hypothetical protein n=1 Tax=Stutzerimonas nitrititolerans TaxID=2482751 RepID=UPI0028B2185A|nr:hypothetical protein [Stutzerimonas nitrititolerans]